MKNALNQRGSIRTRLVTVIAAAVLVIIGSVGSAFAFTDHSDLTDTIAQSTKLSGEEHHAQAVKLLHSTQDHWLVQILGVKDAEIREKLDEFEARVQHQRIYQQALEQKDEKEWEKVIELLARIPDHSFYTHEAELIIEESKRSILELQLEAERTARIIAEKTAVKEEQARLVAEDRASEEAELRAIEELARLDAEERALDEAHLRAIEEVAKKAAEMRANQEALLRAGEEVARKKAEQEAERQRLAKEQEEKARVLVLARTDPMIRGIVSGELKYFIEPLPSYAGSRVATAVEDVAISFSSWGFYGASVKRVYTANNADLTISWIRDYGQHILGESIFKAHIKVGLGSNNCSGEWRPFDSNTVTKVLWHELGHSMGYGHSSDPDNVMYFQTANKYEVDSEISVVIAGGWWHTFPICGFGKYSYTFETDDPNNGFNIFVLPPGSDPKSVSGEGGNVYVGCGKSGVYRYSGSCTVANGAFIYIFNTSYSSAIRLSGSILSLNNPPWPDMTWDQEAYQHDDDLLTNYWKLFH